ncbi:E3 ubiquitin-protein ligase RNF115 [Eumeta japonica]|uniref:RING-type E3 ubiquitin transferase n=1 Tax=Eumeta variegata TaxID=151549 RepID=A0A4C1ZHG1_EUMVA|nr:E3 ubiquitin-protein ligase RNF115 [Eumeta japonica]
MADAMVERRPTARFFCHRCNVEFEDVLQDYICPYCASGFIEQLEATETEGSALSGDVSDVSDADMSNLDDTDEFHQVLTGAVARRRSLVGAPGDYVVGGEGLDAVVTQLLGQLENAGPPPLPRDQIAALPREDVTPEQAAADTTCSVCWETFKQGEQVSRLECEHTFHSACIEPWLRLHATCPICRRSLLSADAPTPAPAAPTAPADAPRTS